MSKFRFQETSDFRGKIQAVPTCDTMKEFIAKPPRESEKTQVEATVIRDMLCVWRTCPDNPLEQPLSSLTPDSSVPPPPNRTKSDAVQSSKAFVLENARLLPSKFAIYHDHRHLVSSSNISLLFIPNIPDDALSGSTCPAPHPQSPYSPASRHPRSPLQRSRLNLQPVFPCCRWPQ